MNESTRPTDTLTSKAVHAPFDETMKHFLPLYFALALSAALGCSTAPPPPVADIRAARARASPPSVSSTAEPVMLVHFIDVGQGAATLFEFPCAAVLVDTGGESNAEFKSTGRLAAYLEEFFARRTDLGNRLTSLILTHPHIDHTRGVQMVRDRWKPRNIVTNGLTTGSGAAQQRMAENYAAANDTGPDPVQLRKVWKDDIVGAGLSDDVIDPVTCVGIDPKLTVLWGRVRFSSTWSSSDFGDANNHSIVLRVDFGDASVLITGDLEEAAIADLLVRCQGTGLLECDVYQVGHHGSLNGTTEELVGVMSPDHAVISCGAADRELSWTAWAYGHPRKEIIEMLQAGIPVARNDLDTDVGLRARAFEEATVTKSIWATGWDGTVVLEAKADGTIQVVGAAPVAPQLSINVNTASATDLTTLPTIGPAKAAAIITYRTTVGRFARLEDLDNVPGIGPATIQAIRHLATVGP